MVSHQPGLLGDGMLARHVLIARQRMRDEDGVRLGGVELAIGLVGDAKRREQPVAIEPQGLSGGNVEIVAAGGRRLQRTRIDWSCKSRGFTVFISAVS